MSFSSAVLCFIQCLAQCLFHSMFVIMDALVDKAHTTFTVMDVMEHIPLFSVL